MFCSLLSLIVMFSGIIGLLSLLLILAIYISLICRIIIISMLLSKLFLCLAHRYAFDFVIKAHVFKGVLKKNYPLFLNKVISKRS